MDQIVITDDDMVELIAAEQEVEIIALTETEQEIVFVGDAGIQGAPGVGVVAGGTTGQFYRKASDADYDGEWSSATAGDATFSQDFSPTTNVTVTHNLGKYPSVTVFTSAGDEVEVAIEHLSVNQLELTFAQSFGGKVVCN